MGETSLKVRKEAFSNFHVAAVVVLLTAILTIFSPGGKSIPYPWTHVSAFFGWTYFFSWTVSCYPQILLNFKIKSVAGVAPDFLIYNLWGFSGYAIYTFEYFWNEQVREDYSKAHNGKQKLVSISDVFFACHALLISILATIQIFCIYRDRQPVQRMCIVVSILVLCTTLGSFIMCSRLTFLNVLGYIKLAITLVKYPPQILLNFRRKSTAGMSIQQWKLDLIGGVFSFLQLAVDAIASGSLSLMFSNPIKLGLSGCALIYDLTFIVQHYILYRQNSRDTKADVAQLEPFLEDIHEDK